MSIPSIASYALPVAEELPRPSLDWEFDPSKAALLIHDMQRYFLDFYQDGFSSLCGSIVKLREIGLPAVYTAQPPKQKPESRGLLTDRWGIGLQDRDDIVAELEPTKDDLVLTKHRYSAFWGTELLEWMRSNGRDQLVICGVYAHIGITATAIDAFSHGIKPFVVADAIADFSREQHLTALTHMAATCSVITTVEKLTAPASTVLTLDQVRQAILGLIDEPADDDENLIDAGMDSISLMGLIDEWKQEHHQVEFADLASEPTILGIYKRLVGQA